MTTLTPTERRAKRAAAHNLHPVVAVGQHGLTPAVLHEIHVALAAHELIKVRVFDDDRAAREALMARICAEMQCAPVQHIGKLLVLWRPNPGKDSRTPKTRAPARKAKRSGTDDPRKAKKKPRTRDVRKEKAKATPGGDRSAGTPRARTRDDGRPPRTRGAPNARRHRDAPPAVETEPPALPPRGDQSRRRRRAVKT